MEGRLLNAWEEEQDARMTETAKLHSMLGQIQPTVMARQGELQEKAMVLVEETSPSTRLTYSCRCHLNFTAS